MVKNAAGGAGSSWSQIWFALSICFGRRTAWILSLARFWFSKSTAVLAAVEFVIDGFQLLFLLRGQREFGLNLRSHQ